MSRVLRILLGYLFPALLLHGESWGGWVGGWESRLPYDSQTTVGVEFRRSGHCARLPDPAGAQNPFPQRRLQCFLLQQAAFFLEGCEPRPDTFYLSHP